MRASWAGVVLAASSGLALAMGCNSTERNFGASGGGGSGGASLTSGDSGSMMTEPRGGSSPEAGQSGSGGDSTQGGTAGTLGQGLANGLPCAANDECASTFCSDSVCCDTACGGACEACAQAHTGQLDGSCAPVLSGADPHDDCQPAAAESCGDDGTCDGAGACRKYGPSQVCEPASCSGSDHSPARACDGQGACEPATSTSCGEFPCSPGGCEQPCSVDPDCPDGSYCATDVCQNEKTDGQECAAGNECRSGHCVDGVCCESACAGSCAACSQAKTDQESGRCVGVPAGGDPDNECAVDSGNACGRDGACSGGGACRVRSLGTACGTASCSGSTLTPEGSCNGASACSAGSSQPCPNNFTCASGTACRTTCTANSHCVSGYFCSSGSCVQKKGKGDGCSSADQCSSGFCKDSVCCESSCSLACQGCSNATTGQSNGTCAAKTSSTTKPCPTDDPDSCVNLQTSVSDCGSCGNACEVVPNTNGSCSGGGCAWACKDQDFVLPCQAVGGKPNCSQWDFEVPNQTDGWVLFPTVAANNEGKGQAGPLASTASQNFTGLRSLAIPHSTGSEVPNVNVKVKLCATGTPIPLNGRTLYFTTRSVPAQPSTSGFVALWFFTDPALDPQLASQHLAFNSNTSSSWTSYSFVVPDTWDWGNTGIGLGFQALPGYSGTIYLDDIRIE
jgi:hypothetical protein